MHYVQIFLNAAKISHSSCSLFSWTLRGCKHRPKSRGQKILYVSKQFCSSGRGENSLRLLVSVRLQYKALIQTLWFGGWEDVSCTPVRGFSLKKRVFCSPRWAASTGADSIWCRHSDSGKSTHLYPSELLKTFSSLNSQWTLQYLLTQWQSESLAHHKKDGDITVWSWDDVNLRISLPQVSWTKG